MGHADGLVLQLQYYSTVLQYHVTVVEPEMESWRTGELENRRVAGRVWSLEKKWNDNNNFTKQSNANCNSAWASLLLMLLLVVVTLLLLLSCCCCVTKYIVR